MPVKQFCRTLTQTPPRRAVQLVHRRPMPFHRNRAARFYFNDGFGSFHATDIALPPMKVKQGYLRPRQWLSFPPGGGARWIHYCRLPSFSR